MTGLEVALLLAPAHPTMKILCLPGYPLEGFSAEALPRKVRDVLDAP